MNSKPKLQVKLFVDTEADFYYISPSPHFKKKDVLKWKANKLAARVYRYPWPSRKGFINLIEEFKKHQIPAIFCITGHLYLKECDGPYHFGIRKPEHQWYRQIIGNDWYHWDKGGSYKTYPGRYLGDIIEKEASNNLFRFGLHGFAHEALTLESKEVIDSIVSTGLKAAEQVGAKIDFFACPFELTEDEADPDKIYSVLRKHGIKNIFYSGTDMSLQIKRYFAVKPIVREHGMNKLWISGYFEGTSSESHLNKIMKEILANRDREAIYWLGTHDFTHKTRKNTDRILSFLKEHTFV